MGRPLSELELVPLAEVAHALGVTPQWLRAQCRTGRVTHVRIARQYRFTPDQVAELIKRHETAAHEPDEVRPAQPKERRKQRLPRRYASFGNRHD